MHEPRMAVASGRWEPKGQALSPGAWVWPTGLWCDPCGLSHRVRWNCPGSDRRDTAGRHSGGQTQGRAWGPASWRGAWESPSRPAPGAVGLQAWGARIENRCPRGEEARHGRDPARRHEGVGSRPLPRQLPPYGRGGLLGSTPCRSPPAAVGGGAGPSGRQHWGRPPSWLSDVDSDADRGIVDARAGPGPGLLESGPCVGATGGSEGSRGDLGRRAAGAPRPKGPVARGAGPPRQAGRALCAEGRLSSSWDPCL